MSDDFYDDLDPPGNWRVLPSEPDAVEEATKDLASRGYRLVGVVDTGAEDSVLVVGRLERQPRKWVFPDGS